MIDAGNSVVLTIVIIFKIITSGILANKPESFIRDIHNNLSKSHFKLSLLNVNLIKFVEGKIDISFNQNLDKNFVRNLSEKLFLWTGKRWVISLSKEKGNKTFSEIKNIQKNETLNLEKNEKIYEKFKKIFPDGELLEVKKNE